MCYLSLHSTLHNNVRVVTIREAYCVTSSLPYDVTIMTYDVPLSHNKVSGLRSFRLILVLCFVNYKLLKPDFEITYSYNQNNGCLLLIKLKAHCFKHIVTFYGNFGLKCKTGRMISIIRRYIM